MGVRALNPECEEECKIRNRYKGVARMCVRMKSTKSVNVESPMIQSRMCARVLGYVGSCAQRYFQNIAEFEFKIFL